jgi:hypothetical protein
MHAALFLIAAVLPGDNPVRVEGDIITPPGPLELRGRWAGLWLREGEAADGAVYHDGRLTLPMTPAWTARLTLTDEGRGRCRVRLGDVEMLGIYQRTEDRLVLCWRAQPSTRRAGGLVFAGCGREENDLDGQPPLWAVSGRAGIRCR